MKTFTYGTRVAALAATGMLLFAGCADTSTEEDQSAQTEEEQPAQTEETADSAEHDHNPDGGPPPEGIQEAEDPTYPVDSTVILEADHMPGMQGTEATISGAFDTVAYSVTYTPTTGGDPVVDHKWVVHEELENPGEPPLDDGTEVVLEVDHMEGMAGAEATTESSTDETVYMVDFEMDGMEMTNHKWVVESEIQPTE